MQDSKECFKCSVVKPLKEFYKHPQMFDGHLNKCKECAKKDTRLNREMNIDYYLEYDRQRGALPSRVNARAIYSKTNKGKEAFSRASKKWKEGNKIKRACHVIFGNYIRGKIKPKQCSVCGETGKIHGHHDDYAKPLEVRWLCSDCHTKWHKENGEGVNGS